MDDAAGYEQNLVSSASPVRTHNLPTQLTSFVGRTARDGRSAAAAPLRSAGDPHRRGWRRQVAPRPGGRRRSARRVVAGVWFVELASVAKPDLVAQAVAARLGIREQPGRSYRATLCDVLRTKHLLLVLDNCEHLLDVTAELANDLLQTTPHLVLLTTSREPLNIVGEVSWPVPALVGNRVRRRQTDAGSGAVVRRAATADSTRICAQRRRTRQQSPSCACDWTACRSRSSSPRRGRERCPCALCSRCSSLPLAACRF